jgi:hypothetical protein
MAPVQKNDLPPGDSTVVELIFNTRISKGKITKNAKISSTDSSRASVSIDFSGTIVADSDSVAIVHLMPAKMNFNQDTTKYSVLLNNKGSSDIQLIMIGKPGADVLAKGKSSVVKGNKSAKLEFEWKGKKPEYDINHTITYETGSTITPRFSIPYTIIGEKGPRPPAPSRHVEIPKGSQPPPYESSNRMPVATQNGLKPKPVTPNFESNADSLKGDRPVPATQWPPK